MTARYTFDPGQSRFTVQGFATGLLSFAAHSPTFEARDFHGHLDFDTKSLRIPGVDLTARSDALELTGHYSASDRSDIETRMRKEVLQTETYREIRYTSADGVATDVATGRYRVRLDGRLTLRGVTRTHRIEAEIQLTDDALRLLGETRLSTSEFGINPVTALGGMIRLKDDLTLTFDIIGLREAS